mmetsp:Transcript_21133/g.29331  ORF Transcript_21133/g.29331 Transcript_21133/m.29331 type:complete len:82 (-) Transcript_21133:466-711(-)
MRSKNITVNDRSSCKTTHAFCFSRSTVELTHRRLLDSLNRENCFFVAMISTNLTPSIRLRLLHVSHHQQQVIIPSHLRTYM